MSEEEFWACTPRAFFNAYSAHERQRELDIRTSWEQARFVATATINCWSKRPVRATQVCRFPWEKAEVNPEDDKPRIEWLVHKYSKIEGRDEWKELK